MDHHISELFRNLIVWMPDLEDVASKVKGKLMHLAPSNTVKTCTWETSSCLQGNVLHRGIQLPFMCHVMQKTTSIGKDTLSGRIAVQVQSM